MLALSQLVKFFMSIFIKIVNWFTKINKVSIISQLMNFTELYSLIKIIDIYQEQKWSKNWTLSDTIVYRGFIRNMTINRNKLFSAKEVGFEPFICIPRMPWCSSLASKISCSTVSKTFGKLTKTLQPIFSLSRFFLTSSVRLIKAWKAEYCCLKPNCSG